jgi:hypothetical protein
MVHELGEEARYLTFIFGKISRAKQQIAIKPLISWENFDALRGKDTTTPPVGSTAAELPTASTLSA